MKILILSLSANPDSLSRRAALEFQRMLTSEKVESELIDIRSLPPVWVDGRDLEDYPKEYGKLNKAVTTASGVAIFMPIYCYTVSSPAKTISEVIGDAFTRKPVAFITSAGSLRSHLAVRDLMASMSFEQETICFPKVAQITSQDFSSVKKLRRPAKNRLSVMATEFPAFVRAVAGFIKSYPGSS
jgi:NAD(P)H-dependent FMN reductase